MTRFDQYPLYNAFSPIPKEADHPLRDLLPEDDEHGWHVARNLRKPLNHLDFLRRQESIAAELHLHSIHTPRFWFDVNYELLSQHQAGKTSTREVIRHLAVQLHTAGHPLSEEDITIRLREYAAIRHMEFHPSDVCNLTCCGCTYGHDEPERKPPPVCFPFGPLHRMAQMQPRSMVIIGGGEPTLYRSGACYFQEMIEEIRRLQPGIALALITNGVYKPPGDWPDQLQWIRVSLDAATETTYAAFRGKQLFWRVLQNYLSYLDHEIRYVGIGFLFSRLNIHEYVAVARLIFELVKREKPQALHKVNIQYRPLLCDPYGCRQCHVNYVFEQGLKQKIQPSTAPEVLADPMY